jgi:uncharacterized membrane-anchored protein YitT (DUF2179 family)
MNQLKKFRKNVEDFFYDHDALRKILEYTVMFFGATLSAFLLAYGYKAFSAPTVEIQNGKNAYALVTGGASGISQILVKIVELFGVDTSQTAFGNTTLYYLLQSGFYVLVNIPILVIAFLKVGKKFTIFSIINVLMYFVIVNILPSEFTNIFYSNGDTFNFAESYLPRALFAGIMTGLSTAVALVFNHSAGGIDCVSVIVQKKTPGKSLGKIILTINAVIVIVYTILNIIHLGGDYSSVTLALYTLIYFFTSSTVVDAVFARDRKVQLQIITSIEQMPDVLIAYFPHSCTVIKGKGAFTKQDKFIIYTVLSSFEQKKALKVIHETDPGAFVTLTKVSQVYGRFFIKPRG